MKTQNEVEDEAFEVQELENIEPRGTVQRFQWMKQKWETLMMMILMCEYVGKLQSERSGRKGKN